MADIELKHVNKPDVMLTLSWEEAQGLWTLLDSGVSLALLEMLGLEATYESMEQCCFKTGDHQGEFNYVLTIANYTRYDAY